MYTKAGKKRIFEIVHWPFELPPNQHQLTGRFGWHIIRELVEKHLNNKEYVLVVLIDLSIAFDCIETEEILPEKLRYYGATDKTVDFFKEFFTGRKHHTNWFGEKSETLNLSNHSCVRAQYYSGLMGNCLRDPSIHLWLLCH